MQKVKPDKILDYFSNWFSYDEARQLESVPVARLIYYLAFQINTYNVHFFVITFLVEYVGSYYLLCVREMIKSYC